MFRIIIICSLFAAFVVIFGYPACQKYLSGGILIERGEEYSQEITPPAITFCPRNLQTKLGWKHDANLTESILSSGPCKDFKKAKEVINCIEKDAYTLGDALAEAHINMGMVDLSTANLWQERLDYFFVGKCFTLKVSKGSIGFSYLRSLQISFNTSLEYYFMMHDPDFFVSTSNPKTIPRILLSLDENFGWKLIYIDVTQHIKLNRKSHPCEETQGYSLRKCVKKSIATSIGCQTPWDSFVGFDRCKTAR